MSRRTKRGAFIPNRRTSNSRSRIVKIIIAGSAATFVLMGNLGSFALYVDGCSAIVDPPGLVEVGEPVRLTAKVERGKCSSLSFHDDSVISSRLQLTTIPLNDYVEAKLQAQDKMKIKAESVPSKPIPDTGGASWTWELTATEAGSYEMSLQFVRRDAKNEKDVAESNAEYFTIEATHSDWAFFENGFNKITSLFSGATAMIAAVSSFIAAIAIWFGWKNRRTSTESESAAADTD